jgi:hypothetical protein
MVPNSALHSWCKSSFFPRTFSTSPQSQLPLLATKLTSQHALGDVLQRVSLALIVLRQILADPSVMS